MHREIWASRMQDKLHELQESYPDVLRAVETRHVATIVLRKQLKVVDQLKEHGELSEMDAAMLVDGINTQRKAIHYAKSHALGNKDIRETLLEVPALAFLGSEVATNPNAIKSNDYLGQKWQEDCKKILDTLREHVREKAYNKHDVVAGPSLLPVKEGPHLTDLAGRGGAGGPLSEESHCSTLAEPSARMAAPKERTRGAPAATRKRRGSVEILAVAAVNIAHGIDHAIHGDDHNMSPRDLPSSPNPRARGVSRDARSSRSNADSDAPPKPEATSTRPRQRGSVVGALLGGFGGGGGGPELSAEKERSLALHEVYDHLYIVKRGQLTVGDQPTTESQRGSLVAADELLWRPGEDPDAASTELRCVGPSQITGLACVLQQVNLEALDRDNHLPPAVSCSRAAEVLVISGRAIRDAINAGGAAGQDLRRELWCMYAKEVGTRVLRVREPFREWSDSALADQLERGWVLEWEEEHEEIEIQMHKHIGVLISGQCLVEREIITSRSPDRAMSGRRSGESAAELSRRSTEPEMSESDSHNGSGDWRKPGAVLRPNDRLVVKQDDPMESEMDVIAATIAAGMAAARGRGGGPGGVAPPLASSSSGEKDRLAGHKRIRLLCLPVGDSMRLHMEAPVVYTIANDPNERRFAPPRKSLVSSIGLRSSVQNQVKMSTKNLLGDGKGGRQQQPEVAASSKRLLDVFSKVKRQHDLDTTAADGGSGDASQKKGWKKFDIKALMGHDGLVTLSSAQASGASAAAYDVGGAVHESVSADAAELQTVHETGEEAERLRGSAIAEVTVTEVAPGAGVEVFT